MNSFFTKLLFTKGYTRNIVTLITGTGIAQIIPIALSPILTRLYSPADFGTLALYLAITSIFSILVTGRYELAILLPKQDRDAIHLFIVSVILSLLLSSFFFLLILLFKNYLVLTLGIKRVSNWVYLVPITTLLIGIYQSINYWIIRKGLYSRLSINRIIQSSSSTLIQLGSGYIGQNAFGLIIGQIVGQLLTTYLLIKKFLVEEKEAIRNINRKRLLAIAKRYIDFPKYLIFAHGFNTAAGQVPVFFISTLFSVSTAGFYTLTQRVLGAPMGLVANAIGDVFRQEASQAFSHNNECKEIYNKTFKRLFAISFFPFIFFFIFAPKLFSLIFGEQWQIAGEYSRILTPMFFFQFITSPLSAMFMIAEKQKLDLIWQIVLVIVTSAAFIIGYWLGSIYWSLVLFSSSYSIMYSINGFMTYRFAVNKRRI